MAQNVSFFSVKTILTLNPVIQEPKRLFVITSSYSFLNALIWTNSLIIKVKLEADDGQQKVVLLTFPVFYEIMFADTIMVSQNKIEVEVFFRLSV